MAPDDGSTSAPAPLAPMLRPAEPRVRVLFVEAEAEAGVVVALLLAVAAARDEDDEEVDAPPVPFELVLPALVPLADG